jgi:hypothetical protein
MNVRSSRRRGIVLVLSVVCMSILVIVFGTLTRMAMMERSQARSEERRLRAGWLAESGLERAWVKLAGSPTYPGETWNLTAESLRGRDPAIIRITVDPIPGDPRHVRVTSRADYPREGSSRARQTRTAIFAAKNSTTPGAKP